MAIVPVTFGGSVLLGSAQTGNVDTTNTAQRLNYPFNPGALTILSAIGATPTVKVDIQGSVDGTNFFNIPYALAATARTFILTQITITTATTNTYFLQELVPWNYLKCVYSSNTNVTLTANAWL